MKKLFTFLIMAVLIASSAMAAEIVLDESTSNVDVTLKTYVDAVWVSRDNIAAHIGVDTIISGETVNSNRVQTVQVESNDTVIYNEETVNAYDLLLELCGIDLDTVKTGLLQYQQIVAAQPTTEQ